MSDHVKFLASVGVQAFIGILRAIKTFLERLHLRQLEGPSLTRGQCHKKQKRNMTGVKSWRMVYIATDGGSVSRSIAFTTYDIDKAEC